MTFTADLVSLVLVAALWGGMLFFASVFAPLVFIRLEADQAGRFIRAVFPVYYLAMGMVSALAALALAAGTAALADAAAMAVVVAGFVVARQVLMPAINRARDAAVAEPVAARRFNRLHRLSVVINAVQLLVVLAVLVRFVWR